METLHKNIKYLRKQKGQTQESFSKELGIKRSLLGAYEEGRAKPKLEIMTIYCQMFNISLEQLISKDLQKSALSQWLGKGEVDKDITGNNMRVVTITEDTTGRENITMVPAKAAAGYLSGFADREYMEELPKFNLPMFNQGTYRAFEIKGDSMLPIQPGTIVVTEYIEDWTDIKDGHTYIVLTKEDGLVYKRAFNQINESQELFLRSDNPAYQPYSVHVNEVMEVWKAKAYISTVFPDVEIAPQNLLKMVMDLQNEVKNLKDNN